MIKNYNTKVLLFKFSFLLLCLGAMFDTKLFTNVSFGLYHADIDSPKLAILIYVIVFFLITDYDFKNMFTRFDKKFVGITMLILGSALISTMFSPAKSVAFKTLTNYTAYFICLLITIKNLKQFKECTSFVFYSFFFLNLILAISCILDFYSPEFNRFLIASFGHPEAKHSFFEINGIIIARPSGLLTDTNLTGFSIALTLILIVLNYRFVKNKIFVWAFIILGGYAFGMLSSRSAQIIILFSGVMFIIFRKVNYKIVLKILLVFFAVQIATPQTLIRIQQMFNKKNIEEEAKLGRIMIWRAAWGAFNEHKIIGLGPGVFFDQSLTYIGKTVGEDKEAFDKMERYGVNPHNIFLVFLSEQGILGFILFAALLIFLFFTFVKEKKYISLTIFLGLFIVSNLSNYAPYFKYYLVMCIVIYSLEKSNFQIEETKLDS